VLIHLPHYNIRKSFALDTAFFLVSTVALGLKHQAFVSWLRSTNGLPEMRVVSIRFLMLDIVNIFLSKGQQLRGIFMIGNGFDINALDEEKLPAEEAQIGDQSDKANRNDNGKQISVNVGY